MEATSAFMTGCAPVLNAWGLKAMAGPAGFEPPG